MTPEEFDIDFDFDREYGYHNNPVKKDTDSDDFDLDAALERELGPDFDALFEKEFAAAQEALNAELAAAQEEAAAPAQEDLEQTRFFDSFTQLDDDAEDEEDAPLTLEAPDDDFLFAAAAAARAELDNDEAAGDDSPAPIRERRPAKKGLDLSAIGEKIDLKALAEKIDTEAIKENCAVAGAVIAENARNFVDALKECKPGKMDKHQKRRFKNDVLPILIGGAAFLMCLIFIIGSLGRAAGSEERELAALQESIAQAEREAAAAAEIKNTLDTAAMQAAEYDYQAAITTLDSYKTAERELTDEMAAARAEYAAAMTDLVVWDDPAAIANLSFHVLIEDSQRAYADANYSNSFRTKFITTKDFASILEQLHKNNYVLVNLESCIAENTDASGKTTYTVKPIYLPAGKTPIMITETLVNYFGYMVDGDDDGTPDATGAGFAHRLVISGGEIKAEYIDASGQSHVGDYDLVPILNSFLEEHPDFSYRGAKAILAVTGSEGVFGWRNLTDASAADSVRDIAEVLRADGYQIACNSYANLDYSGKTSIAQINADIDQWKQNITPILGETDIMIIAKGSGIKTRGGGFQAMEEAGFHYIIDCTDTPGGDLTAEYFHQHRIMVTGENLDSGVYDAYFTFTQAN